LNIIPYNEIGSEYNRPSDDKIQNFIDNLSDAPFTMTTRWSKGSHINAGCGQLVVSE